MKSTSSLNSYSLLSSNSTYSNPNHSANKLTPFSFNSNCLGLSNLSGSLYPNSFFFSFSSRSLSNGSWSLESLTWTWNTPVYTHPYFEQSLQPADLPFWYQICITSLHNTSLHGYHIHYTKSFLWTLMLIFRNC